MKKLLFILLVIPHLVHAQHLVLSQIADPAPIAITITGSFTAFTNITGSASASQSVRVDGTGLPNPINIPVPSGFEASPDNATWVTTSVSYTPSGGQVINQLFWMRVKSTTAVGPYSGNAVAASSPAANVNIPYSATVSPVPSLVISPTSRTVSGTAGTAGTFVTDTATFVGLGSSVAVTTSSPLEVSVDSGTNYGTSKTMTHSPTVMRVRTAASATAGTGNDTVFLNATGVSTVKLPVAYTVAASGSSSDTARFMMSLTSQTPPAGFVSFFGDPSTGVRTATNGAGTITISTVSTANWGPTLSACASDNDGQTGSTVSGFPDNILLHQHYTYSGGSSGGTFADSATQGLGKPNYTVSGLNSSATYHVELTGNLDNTRFSGLAATNSYYALGAGTTATIGTNPAGGNTLNLQGNKTQKIVWASITPNSSGQINFYLFTIHGQDINDCGGIQIWKN